MRWRNYRISESVRLEIHGKELLLYVRIGDAVVHVYTSDAANGFTREFVVLFLLAIIEKLAQIIAEKSRAGK